MSFSPGTAITYTYIIVFEPHSIYSMRLAKKGELLTHHKDKAVLTLMKVENVVEKDFVTVHPVTPTKYTATII